MLPQMLKSKTTYKVVVQSLFGNNKEFAYDSETDALYRYCRTKTPWFGSVKMFRNNEVKMKK
jgi:hypothetical protein